MILMTDCALPGFTLGSLAKDLEDFRSLQAALHPAGVSPDVLNPCSGVFSCAIVMCDCTISDRRIPRRPLYSLDHCTPHDWHPMEATADCTMLTLLTREGALAITFPIRLTERQY